VTKLPTAPPEIPGLTIVRPLGGGGFADVYLYEQRALGRNVAVKVLRANASTDEVQRQFTAESRLMAALSDHINIVTIHDAAIAPDGRPYLVMAYCPGLNLADRYKTQQIAVAEVLSIGVQLAGAVETAHRQGILHRDIKPANVLTAAGGRPALTDFGISVAMGVLHEEESVGLSIPWSPPEMLSGTPTGDHRADVYSLTATLFTLLARRSPYELPGRSNDQVDLITRIQRTALTPTGRPDVPQSVEVVLATGLAKDPARRYQSALELARALQRLESEIGGAITPVDISAEDPVAARAEIAPENDGRTRIRPLVIEAQGVLQAPGVIQQVIGAHQSTTSPSGSSIDRTQMRGTTGPTMSSGQAAATDHQGAPEHTRMRGIAPHPGYLGEVPSLHPRPPADTEARPQPPAIPAAVPQSAAKRSRLPLMIGVGAAVVLIAVIGLVVGTRGSAPAAAPVAAPTTRPTSPALVQVNPAPTPMDLTGARSGSDVVFTWKNPSPLTGDRYQWRRTDQDAAQSVSWSDSSGTTATVAGVSRACIEVVVIRADSSLSSPAQACGPKA
jgi:serine/threonine protein kinase